LRHCKSGLQLKNFKTIIGDFIAARASANICDYVEIDSNGKVKLNLFTLTRDSAKGLAKYRITKDGFSITLTDSLRALELLGRHLGLFGKRHEHDFGDRDLDRELAAFLRLDKLSGPELKEALRLLKD
jgi:hypothetical protein